MKCPHCHKEINESFQESYLGSYNDGSFSFYSMRCPNGACHKLILKLAKVKRGTSTGGGYTEKIISESIVYPLTGNRDSASDVVDKNFASDYNEACLVLPHSPKASAALSRRCLQNIIRLKAGIKERNLKIEIDKLIAENKLPSYISDNLEIIRGFGNIAAHSMEDQVSGEILDVEPNEAEFLLDILELLFDFYFIQAAKAAKMKSDLNQKLASAGQKPIA